MRSEIWDRPASVLPAGYLYGLLERRDQAGNAGQQVKGMCGWVYVCPPTQAARPWEGQTSYPSRKALSASWPPDKASNGLKPCFLKNNMVSHANCALSHMHTDVRMHTLDRANSDQNRYFVLGGYLLCHGESWNTHINTLPLWRTLKRGARW